jgi:hypothetical protein
MVNVCWRGSKEKDVCGGEGRKDLVGFLSSFYTRDWHVLLIRMMFLHTVYCNIF